MRYAVTLAHPDLEPGPNGTVYRLDRFPSRTSRLER